MANLAKAFLSTIGKAAIGSGLGENTEEGLNEFETNKDPLYISYYRQEGVHPESSKSGTCNFCLAMNGHMFRRSQLLQADGSLGHHPGCCCTFVPVSNDEAFFQGDPSKGPIEMTGEKVWGNARARNNVGSQRLAAIPNKTLKQVLAKRNMALSGNKTAMLGRIFKGWL